MIGTCESAPSTIRKLATEILLIHYQLSTIGSVSRGAFNRLSQVHPTWKENKLFIMRYIKSLYIQHGEGGIATKLQGPRPLYIIFSLSLLSFLLLILNPRSINLLTLHPLLAHRQPNLTTVGVTYNGLVLMLGGWFHSCGSYMGF